MNNKKWCRRFCYIVISYQSSLAVSRPWASYVWFISVATVMALRDFGPYGIIFTTMCFLLQTDAVILRHRYCLRVVTGVKKNRRSVLRAGSKRFLGNNTCLPQFLNPPLIVRKCACGPFKLVNVHLSMRSACKSRLQLEGGRRSYHHSKKVKVKQSRYTRWRCLGGGIAPTHSRPRY
jgi:hypothetical protein